MLNFTLVGTHSTKALTCVYAGCHVGHFQEMVWEMQKLAPMSVQQVSEYSRLPLLVFHRHLWPIFNILVCWPQSSDLNSGHSDLHPGESDYWECRNV